MANVKNVRVTVLNNGTITLWKHELSVTCLHNKTGKLETWDWKAFVARMGSFYVSSGNSDSNKIILRAKNGANTGSLLGVLKGVLKDYFVDEEGDSYTSGFSAVEVSVLRTVSTKQAHVMFV